MTPKHGFESQMAVNVIGKCRAEFPQLSQRKVLQLAILLDTLLHGMRNRLMCQTEGNTAFREVRSRRHGVHESFFASRAHAFEIKDHLPHEAGGNLKRETYGIRGIKERLLRFLQVFVVSQRKSFDDGEQSHLGSNHARSLGAD